MNFEEFYKPIIKDFDYNAQIGLAVGNIPQGAQGFIQTKAFKVSNDPVFNTASLILTYFGYTKNHFDSLNRLLVIVSPDNKARIYETFPMTLGFRTKKNKKKGELVFSNEIIDINAVHFEDAIENIEIQDGDMIVWLVRYQWSFGLYFDFSKTLSANIIHKELGDAYRKLMYYGLYESLETSEVEEMIFKGGWFPFNELISDQRFDMLKSFYMESEPKRSQLVGEFIQGFSVDDITELTDRWWDCSFFKAKQTILLSGISAYNSGNYIASIKTLITEIQSLIISKMIIDPSNSLNLNQYKEYIKNNGIDKFKSEMSLFLPDLFYKYIKVNIFSKFTQFGIDIIDTGRHSVAHGNTDSAAYTRERAFQIILTLDQLFYYLN